MGTSQGGGLVLALGSIDPRVKAVVAHVPFLCDFRHHSGTLAADLAKDPRFLEPYEWVDPSQLASGLRAPTLLSSGGKDTTCPTEAIRAIFDRLPGIKSLAHFPELPHTTSIDFYQMAWEWMRRYLLTA